MAFMQEQSTFSQFVMVETANGTESIPAEFVDDPGENWNDETEKYGTWYLESLLDFLQVFEIADIYEVELVSGWFSRLSAPGYMDCTDWSGPFETERAALKDLRDTFELEQERDDNGKFAGVYS